MEQTKILEEKKVKTSSAVWLGAANSFTGILCAFAEGAALTYFYTVHMGLSVYISGIIWIIFGIWNAINDPIYGFIADRTKSKLGRRIPWIRYGAILMAVTYAISWIPFGAMKGNQVFLAAQMIIALFLYDTVYTAVASAIYVMPYEMAVTNKARSPIFLWNIAFSIFSYGIPMFANGFLTDLIENNATIFPFIMAGLGLFAGAIVFVSTFFYKENGYIKEEPQPKFFEGLKMCLKNKSFLLFEVISWTVIYAQAALMMGLTYVNGFWAVDSVQYNGWFGGNSMFVLYGALLLGAVGGIILFVNRAQKWGTRICALIMTGVMATGTLVTSFLGKYFPVTVFGFVCAGVGLAGGLYIVPMVNGDVMDKDELDNGSRREGVYAGINSLITKPAGSLANAIFPIMLAGFGFNKDLKDAAGVTDFINQPQSAKDWMFFCWMFITAILLILSFVAMWFYPLHGPKWNEQKDKLAEEHRIKEQAYEQEMLAKIQASENNPPEPQA